MLRSKKLYIYLPELKKKLYKVGRLTSSLRSSFFQRYGSRFQKAVEAVSEGNVYKYIFKPSGRVVWVVVGRERDYLLTSESFCGCPDFYLNVIVRKRVDACYHILAKVLAEFLGVYNLVEADDESYSSLREEWNHVI